MKKLIILMCLFITSCATDYTTVTMYDDSRIINISSIEHHIKDFDYKYKITVVKYTGRVNQIGYVYTNKECKIGETIWDCK